MTYQVLARKWRPRNFEDVVGQEHVLRAMRHAFDRQSTHHAYLLTGTRGVGKTTLARILARCFNCEQGVTASPCGQCSACTQIDQGSYADLYEVDAASRAKVEETRELMDKVQYSPVTGRYRVYIIDEVHMFSNHSFNALLKVLEEPPDHVRFLLATTEPKKIPPTILSRCVQFGLRALSVSEIDQRLRHIMEQENIPCQQQASTLLAEAADGSLRDALSLLDQAISDGDGQLQEQQVLQMLGTVPKEDMGALLQILIAGDGQKLLAAVDAIIERRPDCAMVLSQLMNMLQDIAVQQISAGHAAADQQPVLAELAQLIPPEQVQLMYQIALHGKRDLPLAPDPGRGFEMCMIRMLAFQPAGVTPQSDNNKQRQPASKTTASTPTAASNEPQPRIPAPRSPQAATTANAVDSSDLCNVHNWQQLIERAGLEAMDRQLAEHCVVLSYSNNLLRLQLQGSSALTAQQDPLAEKLRPHLGHELRLQVHHSNGDDAVKTPADINNEQLAAQKFQRQREIENDPHVKLMCTTFATTPEKGDA